MALSPLSKGALGLLGLSGAAAVSYGVLGMNKQNDAKEIEIQDISVTIKDLKDPNYKYVFPSYFFTKKNFGKDIVEKLKPKNWQQALNQETKLNRSDFLSNINKTESGSFKMKTKEVEDSIAGFAELTAKTPEHGIIMQSEFRLGKSIPSSDAYFLNKLSFLKKEGGVWKLDKAVAWEEDRTKIKKASDMFDAPIDIEGIWKKKQNGPDPLLKQFKFKQPTIFWKSVINSNFDFSKIIFIYSSENWYKKEGSATIIVTDSSTWYNNIPKGEWTFTNK